MQLQGGCLCKSVRWQSSAEPLVTRSCWCRDCQYLAAGNATVNMLLKRDGFSVTGETRAYSSVAASGNMPERHFCPTCGTPVYVVSAARPGFVVVRVGTLDDPNVITPTMNIWTNSAPHWAAMDMALTCVERQPPPPQVPPARP
jgi:hypothetical protein